MQIFFTTTNRVAGVVTTLGNLHDLQEKRQQKILAAEKSTMQIAENQVLQKPRAKTI